MCLNEVFDLSGVPAVAKHAHAPRVLQFLFTLMRVRMRVGTLLNGSNLEIEPHVVFLVKAVEQVEGLSCVVFPAHDGRIDVHKEEPLRVLGCQGVEELVR